MKTQSLWVDEYPTSTNPLRFLWFTTRPHWRTAVASLVFVTIGASLSAGVSYLFKLIVNAAANLSQTHDYHALYVAAAWWIAIQLIGELTWRVAAWFAAYWADGVRATARDSLVAYTTLHSRAYFSDRFAGSLNSKITHAGAGMKEIVNLFLWNFMQFFISVVGAIYLTSTVSPLIATVLFAWVLVVVFINYHFAKWRTPKIYAAQRLETVLTGHIVDLFTNITAMQDYAHRNYELMTLRRTIKDRMNAAIANWHMSETFRTANSIFQAFFAGAMVYLAVTLFIAGKITVGDITMIISLIFLLEGQMLFIGSRINELTEKWSESQESLDEILDPHEIVDSPNAAPLSVGDGSIEVDAITFSYGGNTIFQQLSLNIRAGQRVGLVGRSGAGKSTLVRLLARHHDLQEGAIRIDGQNIAEVQQESLHRAIGIVPQESIMFHRSIRENIAYGKLDATDEEIQRAARMAHASDFIESLPVKYETMVGERGVKLSGGERQRVAIARAILKNAPILLLDEATSALDSESEIKIQEALHELMQGKTVVAIAHRLSTLREMDRILVLDKGQLVEDGTHDSLVAQGGIYAELWAHQVGGFIPDEEEENLENKD